MNRPTSQRVALAEILFTAAMCILSAGFFVLVVAAVIAAWQR